MPLPLSRVEFIALIAMLFATIAFSLDAMLPALPAIADEFPGAKPNSVQLIVTSFVLGMGLGTFFTGPLSDAFGRKPVILAFAALYIVAAYVATQVGSLEALLVARFVQGLGAAGPRVVALAIVRDRVSGREMARVMSFVLMVFALVPAIAPTLGAGLIALGDWRLIFAAFIAFSVISSAWLALRMPETLPKPARLPFRAGILAASVREVLAHPVVRIALVVQGLCFGMLFTMISNVQPIYDITFGMAASFPYWFGAVALASASASFVNASLVMRLGMERLVGTMLLVQIAASSMMLLVLQSGLDGPWLFAAFFLWQITVFFQAGLTLGNLNAIALEPMGHIAGMAASITTALATVLAVLFAVPISLAFDGTPVPMAIGMLTYAVLASILMRALRRQQSALAC